MTADPQPDLLNGHLLALLERIADREEAALDELYQATSSRVFGMVTRILQDAQAAEETTLDVYNEVWEHPERYAPARGRVVTWLVVLARYRALDRLRRDRRERASNEAFEAAAATLVGSEETGADLEVEERAALVRSALERIPERQREAIVASFLGGLSHRQVAGALELPLGTVKRRIRDGLEQLRGLLSMQSEGLA